MGEGIWGRWNANGPGTARLFRELQLGQNFDNFNQAKPGDFMKIFWSRQVGKKRAWAFHDFSSAWRIVWTASMSVTGRATFHLATAEKERSAKQDRLRRFFSRLQTPANLARINNAPFVDTYLASLVRTRSSIAEGRREVRGFDGHKRIASQGGSASPKTMLKEQNDGWEAVLS